MPASPLPPFPSPDRRLGASFLGDRRRMIVILTLFLVTRLLVFLSGQVAWNHFAKATTATPLPAHLRADDLFNRADAVWYVEVARDGYNYAMDASTGVAGGNVGFYPFFPMLVRAVHFLVPDWLASGELVANGMLLAACFLLWELAQGELRSRVGAAWAVAFALLCPGAAWFSMIFAESTFLVLFLVLILACRRRHWLAAAVAGYLLALTRTVGVLACVFVAMEGLSDWLEQRRNGTAPGAGEIARWLLAAAAPVLGYATFLLFMQVAFGDWHAQNKVLASQWPQNAHVVAPWTAIVREMAPMHTSKRLIIYGLLAGGVLLSALSLRALRRPAYPAVAFAFLFIYVSSAAHSPMARYLSVLVPIHLTLAWVATRLPLLGGALLAASASLMCVITGLMVNGYVFY